MEQLLTKVRACTLCKGLPLGPRPLVQASATSRLLIAGQAPGRATHIKGIPFDDASGRRLRAWLGLAPDVFYDPAKVAILPMGFCFPGSGAGGDLPPRAECAPQWRRPLLDAMPDVALTLVIGRYALAWHLPAARKRSLADLAQAVDLPQGVVVLPHPSPRNNRWLAQNPWFEARVLPKLRETIASLWVDLPQSDGRTIC
ncbi:uracil-DNA glycosylase family protein [Pseudorhodobacter turbinis]|uniref:Uracil-DNA glycosylase family protein n=1 Tax=Pseudorhodobacter turbinis TaxID=2500533 RepID=A0A4P8EGH4_9RHOB|nr:uracil-DNA glycosylase family protein [Pseudorhodobacter turbinis]QCO56006.1 uracil-DNA glycosylase family protein [Pseudorhodobacter turbinis]